MPMFSSSFNEPEWDDYANAERISELTEQLRQASEILSNLLEMEVNPSGISRLYKYMTTHCQKCGDETDKDYLQKYGMCCGCYAYEVYADGVPCKEPNPQKVNDGIWNALKGE